MVDLKQMIKQNGGVTFMNKGSIKKAEAMIAPDEQVLYASTPNVSIGPPSSELKPSLRSKGAQNGVLVISNKRLFFLIGVMGTVDFHEMSLKTIVSVEQKSNFTGISIIRVVGLETAFDIHEAITETSKILAALNTARNSPSAVSVVSMSSHGQASVDVGDCNSLNNLDQLERLHDLKIKGVITEEEFQIKKREILNI